MSSSPITSITANPTTTVAALDCSAAIAEATAYTPEMITMMGVCFILGSLVTTLCLLILDGVRVAMRSQSSSNTEE